MKKLITKVVEFSKKLAFGESFIQEVAASNNLKEQLSRKTCRGIKKNAK